MTSNTELEEDIEFIQCEIDTSRHLEQWTENRILSVLEAARQHLADKPHIEAILEARKAATEGEWERFHKSNTTDVHVRGTKIEIIGWDGFDHMDAKRPQHGKNAQFITTAANHANALIKNREGRKT